MPEPSPFPPRPDGPRVPGPFVPAWSAQSRAEPPPPKGWHPVAIALVFGLMFLMVWLWAATVLYGIESGFFVVPLLILLTLPLCARAVRKGAQFDIAGIMVAGLALRFIAVLHRYRFRQDGGVFHIYGSQLAESFRALNFSVDTGAPMPGTGGMRYITGLFEVVTNNNEFATFLVFTWLGFVGCYLMYEAFVTAMPNGDRHRYALLVFFWPTLVYWTSSISKDGWLLFTVGIASLGVARVLARERGGYVLFLIGSMAASVVRPHIAILALVAFGIALLLGRRPSQHTGRATPSGVAKVAGFVVLLAIGGLLATQMGDFLDARDLSVDTAISQNTDRTSQGTAAFEPANPQNPLGYARASVNILFRPFPFEASGIEQLLTSLEAIFLFGLCVVSWRRLASVPFRLRDDPYVAYAFSMLLMMIFVLGTIGNFGILARQRSQVMPFVFVLLCVVVSSRTETRLTSGGRSSSR